MEKKPSNFWPVLILFFLAPVIGELLSGSAPPAEFFNPIGIFMLGALYGSGAILIRELRLRWGKGWAIVLILGAAYGIIEEAWMVKSFFDPNWMDLGLLGTYGRWAGVNWVWSLELTIYHAVFSITIPILLVELAFPAQRHQPWLGRRGMIGFSMLLLADVIFGFLFLTPYRPPLIPYLLSILAVVALYQFARRLPAPSASPQPNPQARGLPRARWLILLGLFSMFGFFFINWGLPELGVPVFITLLATVLLVSIIGWQVSKMSHHNAWGDEQRLSLASGALLFLIILTPLQELDTTRTDNTTGMSIVGLAALVLLIGLWRRMRHLVQNYPTQAT